MKPNQDMQQKILEKYQLKILKINRAIDVVAADMKSDSGLKKHVSSGRVATGLLKLKETQAGLMEYVAILAGLNITKPDEDKKNPQDELGF